MVVRYTRGCCSTFLGLALLLVAALSISTPAIALDEWSAVAAGVQRRHFNNGAVDINILVVDLRRSEVGVKVIVKNDSPLPDGGELLDSMGSRHGVVAAINGDYFGLAENESHLPQGSTVVDGTNWYPLMWGWRTSNTANPDRSAIAFSSRIMVE